jgi:predicted aldo/keto reductase-like oxidoreductase
MNHRTLGKTGLTVSALGFGTMRLPTRGNEAEVDEPAAIAMIRHAIDQGVNYVDTAYPYHGGQSEVVLGKALADGYRQRVYLATKLPIWMVQRRDDCDRLLEEQLCRLQTDRLDFYLIHCLQAGFWQKTLDLDILSWAEKARAQGRFKYFGFSFHDSYETFVQIVDGYNWDVCQIQYNYVCEDVQAGTQGLNYAAAKGLGTIIMEPLFGGTLASPPPSVAAIWDAAAPGRAVDLGLKWLWNKPEVSLVLSGMSTMEQVRQNLHSAGQGRVGCLGSQDLELIARVRDEYRRLSPVPCTKCSYCQPCPQGVNIPFNFEIYNQATVMAGNSRLLCRNLYLGQPKEEQAAACVDCGQCEERCPQQIPIREMLKRVVRQFA